MIAIKPYEKNAKKHPDKQLKQLANVVKEVGWRQPVVVNQQGTIVVGHGRYETWKKYKDSHNLKEIWVMDDSGKTIMGEAETNPLTLEQEKMWRLADNKLNESDWDMGLVVDELKGLSEVMLDLTGFEKYLIIEPNEKDDVIPENVPTVAKLGDIWALGSHRVMCGDSTAKEDVERLMDGKKADMVFTDPPYSVNYEKKQKEILGKDGYNHIENDALSVKDISEDVWRPTFANMYEAAKDDCSFYLTMPQGGDQMMMMMMMSEKWQVKHELIWVKPSPVFSMGRLDYDYKHEPIAYGWKKSHNFYGQGNFTKSVWEIGRDSDGSHPTMKPIALVENALKNSSKNNDVVIDLFLGSGSTLIAAEKTGRICYGMELDPHYCDVIIKRWEDYTGQKAVKIN